MSTQNLKEIEEEIQKIENELRQINPKDDIFKSKEALNDLDELIGNLNDKFIEIKNEKEEEIKQRKDSNYKVPLLGEYNEIYIKFTKLKNQYYKMVDDVSTNYEQKALFDNYQKEMELKKVAVDQIEELKIQDKLLGGIY